jgi:hypothetical protein
MPGGAGSVGNEEFATVASKAGAGSACGDDDGRESATGRFAFHLTKLPAFKYQATPKQAMMPVQNATTEISLRLGSN